MAADLVTRSRVKLSLIISRDMTSVLSSSDQPSSTMKLISASGRNPLSRYSDTAVAPWRLDSLDRSGPRIMGR